MRGDKKYLILSVVCFLGLFMLSIYNYEGDRPIAKDFVNNYYEGYEVEAMDNRSLYGALKAYNSTETSSCIVNPKTLAEDKKVMPYKQALPWIQSSDAISVEKAESFAERSEGVKPFKDGDYIIAPGDLTFINSNTSSNKHNKCIQAQIGNNYRVEFSYVKEWWCHMESKEESYRHTDVVGRGSNNNTERVIVGTIIGKATAGTTATIYKKSGTGWEKCSWKSYYNDTIG